MKTRIKYLVVLLMPALISSCLKDQPFKQEYAGFAPANLNDDWVLATPASVNMDPDLLDQAYRLVYKDTRFTMARSLMVIRNGKLVAEAYPHDSDDINRIANIQSMTKSFTSILVGIALENGLLNSVDQTLFSIYPEHFTEYPEKKTITLRHALTMSTGIDFDNGRHTQVLYHTDDNSVEYVLSQNQKYEPGQVFHYHDGAPQLVSAAVQKQYGKSFSEFADHYLFKPLGITEWDWEAAHDGNTFGAFSLYLKPRDAAKFGQLLLQEGSWNGQQIVDSAWISEATQPQLNSSQLGTPYGFYFWIYPAYGAFAADGHGGQRIMVFPEKELVIVYTAWGYTSSAIFDNLNEVVDLIVSGCN